MKKIILYLLLALPALSFSQNFAWLNIVGDIGNDFGQWADTDSAGNIYVAGFGQGTCIFDTNVISSVDQFWFVAKFDSNGNNRWVAQISLASNEQFDMKDFKVNSKGEAYVVGNLGNNANSYAMLVKVDSAGHVITQGTVQQTCNITTIAINRDDSYYLGGNTDNQKFIRRYSESDSLLWQVLFTGDNNCSAKFPMGLTSDNGLLFSFIFKNTVTITDHFTGSQTLTATQGILDMDRVIAKYDSTGSLVWAKKYDDKLDARDMAVDTATDNFYLLTYGPYATTDDYLLRLDSAGNQLSSQSLGHQPYPVGWAPHLTIHNNSLYFIGGGVDLTYSSYSGGFFALKRFDLDGTLTGQIAPPRQTGIILGDIAFHGDQMYLVGGCDTGTWGNQYFTRHGNIYTDFFITKLGENNMGTVSGIAPVSEIPSIDIYPNPANEQLYVSLPKETNGIITIRDIQGRQIATLANTGTGLQKISLQDIACGMYRLTFHNATTTVSKRFIKQ